MKVFHFGSYNLEDIESDKAVDRTLEQAVRLLDGLHVECSFIGIKLDANTVLQMRYEEAVIYTEILDTRSRTIEHCVLTKPLAEEIIREVYRGGDFRRVPRESFIQWQRGAL